MIPALGPLQEASTEALMRELSRRSVGCLCIVFTVEGGADPEHWRYALKGSDALRSTLLGELHRQISRQMNDNGEAARTFQ